MKLKCLSKGGGFYFPPCHMLDVYGFKILLDCPLDLSSLTIFSPIPTYFTDNPDEDSDYDGGQNKQKIKKPLNANNLIHSDPYYKMVNSLHLSDITAVDVVLISSPMGMFGLPFLTRVEDFSAEIYATEAAARVGQLMMEELITINTELRQFYGPEESNNCPQWMNLKELESLPSALRERISGEDGSHLGGWLALYSAAELKDCIQKIQTLKYAEEICYNGVLTLKPLSSGLEIGACNWTINSPKGNIACLSSSIFASSHAANFDFKGIREYDIILYSDFSHDFTEEYDGNIGTDTGSDFSSTSDDVITGLLLNKEENMEEMEKISFITSAALDSVNLGGSVIIPIGRFGIVQQILENISSSLESLNLKIPIYFISPVAEELLAFSNIIPEWLCTERQEKLFSGQPLFAHVELIAEKKLHLFTDVYSDKLLNIWEEPCIVLCSHWSLRLGPVVHLLRRWSGDPHSLLIMESGVDAELALMPFKPMAMNILQCSFLSGMRLQKVQPLLRFLRPKCVLVPEDFARHLAFSTTNSTQFVRYAENKTIDIPYFDHVFSELAIATDLACQHFDWMELKDKKIKISKLKGELVVEHNKHLLFYKNEQQLEPPKKRLCTFHWGSVNLQNFVETLQKMGINAALETGMLDTDHDHATIRIIEPNNALIEIKGTSTIISAADEKLASSIFEAICSSLNGL